MSKPIQIDQAVPVYKGYRSARVRSLFNVSPEDGARFRAECALPVDEADWQVGLIVGPSGSGKSSIGKACWGAAAYHEPFAWRPDRPIIEEIGAGLDFNAVTGALSAVGLGDAPAWLRPYPVLSTGEKFRAELARLLLEGPQQVVVDEFTSVVDRQIARIGASAFTKAWRQPLRRPDLLLLGGSLSGFTIIREKNGAR